MLPQHEKSRLGRLTKSNVFKLEKGFSNYMNQKSTGQKCKYYVRYQKGFVAVAHVFVKAFGT